VHLVAVALVAGDEMQLRGMPSPTFNSVVEAVCFGENVPVADQGSCAKDSSAGVHPAKRAPGIFHSIDHDASVEAWSRQRWINA
jgi:hypothetical protein